MKTASTGRGKLKAVAFDMDGLMFDTEPVYWKSAEELLRRRGKVYTQEICDLTMGRPPKYCFDLYIEHYGLTEDWLSLQKESERYFIEFLAEGYDAMPGALELLDALERRGIPRCVCTSSAWRVASETLKKGGAIDKVAFVLTCDDVTKGKPDPEVYLTAAKRLGVAPSELLVLEDSVAGCAAANAAGAVCCMLRAEHNKNVDFSGAAAVVERLDAPELWHFLGE